MAEQLINEFTVNRPIEEAWPIICDVERIAPCLPGAQLEEIVQTDDGEQYCGSVKVKLGAIATEFKGEAFFLERDDAAHTALLKGKGRDTKGRGNAAADIAASAESLSPTSTKVTVTTELHITGKVAQFGRGILGDVSGKLIDQFAQNLNEMIDADGPESAEESAEEAAAPSTNDAASTAAEPTVRKIEGPASEPIDLMEFGGSSMLKRAAPAVAIVLLLLLLLRRRKR